MKTLESNDPVFNNLLYLVAIMLELSKKYMNKYM